MAKIVKLALILAVFCIISAGLLAYVYMYTQPRIDADAQVKLEKAKQEVLPQGGRAEVISPRGYSGPIEMLVGVDLSGKVSGIKILNHKETPGLGANIIRPEFLQQFIGKSASDPIEPKQDIDAITGATISTKGVCDGVKDALKK